MPHLPGHKALLLCVSMLAVLAATAGQALATTVTVPFSYTGAAQTWTVPAGVTSATFDLYGAQGGERFQPSPNRGGQATATIAVTPGQTIQVYVGGAGDGFPIDASTPGGFNGGGGGPSTGGGATDIRIGGSTFADRVLVAGGGGGDGGCFSAQGSTLGGGGGGLTGVDSNTPVICTNSFGTLGGGGGTQSAGGTSAGPCSGPGQFGVGGTDSATQFTVNGGGGGGWWGGGAGCNGGAGGGGSGHGPVGTVFNTAVQAGDGRAVITYETQTLGVSKAGTGSGSVTSAPAGIDCGATCSADFSQGSSVTLTATPSPGSAFGGWSGGCVGTSTTCTVSMSAAQTATATFEPTVTALAVTPNAFKPGKKDTPLARRSGTKIAVSVSGDATVRFAVQRKPARTGGTRITFAFNRHLSAGDHSISFSGRLNGRAYPPGSYTLRAIAIDESTGYWSAPATTGFRVKR